VFAYKYLSDGKNRDFKQKTIYSPLKNMIKKPPLVQFAPKKFDNTIGEPMSI
jgi:hypothetical protein